MGSRAQVQESLEIPTLSYVRVCMYMTILEIFSQTGTVHFDVRSSQAPANKSANPRKQQNSLCCACDNQ